MDIFESLLEKHKEGLAEVSQLAWLGGIKFERQRLQIMLADYFDLTQQPNENGKYVGNLEWDRGFQAAMALINNEYNHKDVK